MSKEIFDASIMKWRKRTKADDIYLANLLEELGYYEQTN